MKDEHDSNVALPLIVISLFMLAVMGGGFYLVKRFHVDTPTASTSPLLSPPPPVTPPPTTPTLTPTPIPTPLPTIPTPIPIDPLGVADAGAAGDVMSSIARLRPAFRACYNKGLANDPTMNGNMILEITVDTSGDVTDVTKVGGVGLSADVEQCIMRRARHGSFPAGSSNKIRVPINFVKV